MSSTFKGIILHSIYLLKCPSCAYLSCLFFSISVYLSVYSKLFWDSVARQESFLSAERERHTDRLTGIQTDKEREREKTREDLKHGRLFDA